MGDEVSESRRTAARAAGLWALRVAAMTGVWLALTDSTNAQELALGAAVVAVAAAVVALFAHPPASDTWARIRVPLRVGARRLVRPLALVVRDSATLSATVVRALATRRPIRGAFRVEPYHPGRARRGVGGDVLTEALGSLPPGRYVLGIDNEAGTLIVHELARGDQPADPLER